MAKRAYIGVDGIARKVKGGYVGVSTDFPIYDEDITTTEINVDNISTYFDVANESYYFVGSGDTFTTNNGGVNLSTAKTTLTAKSNMTNISFSYSYSSEATYDKFTLIVAGNTVENAVSGTTTSKTYTGSLFEGESIIFEYTKDSSASANDDRCTFSAMSITRRVKTQIGTETVSVARKIKKAYIGIGGVARPCFGTGKLVYYGTITPLSRSRYSLAATTIGNYALFGGGGGGTYVGNLKTVDAYDKSLTRSAPTELRTNRSGLSATTVGGYALFGCGDSLNYQVSEYVDAYDTSLTRTDATAVVQKRTAYAATTVGNYALFGGGIYDTYGCANVDAYNTSLTRTTPRELSAARLSLAATTVGNYALFGGGAYKSYDAEVATVDAYDTSLTRTTPTELSVARKIFGATTVGNYALFGSSSENKVVDAYDKSLTRTTPTELSFARSAIATTVNGYAIFAGGYCNMTGVYAYQNIVDAYDESLTRTTPTELSVARDSLAATTVGNYALFGGGQTGYQAYSDAVDVYTVQ